MVDKRKRETILKTDQRNLLLELGLQGKFSVNQVDGTKTGSCWKAITWSCHATRPLGPDPRTGETQDILDDPGRVTA
jgi:hypothetical protein